MFAAELQRLKKKFEECEEKAEEDLEPIKVM